MLIHRLLAITNWPLPMSFLVACRCEELKTGQQAEAKARQLCQAQLRKLEQELQSAVAEQQSAGTSHEQTQHQLKQVHSIALLVKATFTSTNCATLADFCRTDLACHPCKQTSGKPAVCGWSILKVYDLGVGEHQSLCVQLGMKSERQPLCRVSCKTCCSRVHSVKL